ncbi:hypothetical protein CAOG_08921 [Capsaspora owczarzaki ATCC 30864]|uniref:Phorbol-ester/DAG-type domain-containing protein n=1 Tax=Capsaspora owczarzaki (strain ATCC 30864) TaxID=595528 RepID=A0A0D2WU54_CAPO3|nr:hypothetical protein CAOG_08921 [Capsaspora owczarzaki ATCC 30864]KJE95378.1 hypothetical protein CAOG_008921 [Capsaspora owczarzaki ATCC 30864]|eukprot:XP_011270592.1 hypothetical protein CAOG_08921 [Capsaspora owczarzaki ATCC 30864]
MSAAGLHLFAPHTFHRPTFCDVCSKFLWGLVRQGLQCTSCQLNAHDACAAELAELAQVGSPAVSAALLTCDAWRSHTHTQQTHQSQPAQSPSEASLGSRAQSDAASPDLTHQDDDPDDPDDDNPDPGPNDAPSRSSTAAGKRAARASDGEANTRHVSASGVVPPPLPPLPPLPPVAPNAPRSSGQLAQSTAAAAAGSGTSSATPSQRASAQTPSATPSFSTSSFRDTLNYLASLEFVRDLTAETEAVTQHRELELFEPPLHMRTLTSNFSRFVAETNPVFSAIEAARDVYYWQHPVTTLMVMLAWVLLCMFPGLLPLVPAMALLGYTGSSHAARVRERRNVEAVASGSHRRTTSESAQDEHHHRLLHRHRHSAGDAIASSEPAPSPDGIEPGSGSPQYNEMSFDEFEVMNMADASSPTFATTAAAAAAVGSNVTSDVSPRSSIAPSTPAAAARSPSFSAPTATTSSAATSTTNTSAATSSSPGTSSYKVPPAPLLSREGVMGFLFNKELFRNADYRHNLQRIQNMMGQHGDMYRAGLACQQLLDWTDDFATIILVYGAIAYSVFILVLQCIFSLNFLLAASGVLVLLGNTTPCRALGRVLVRHVSTRTSFLRNFSPVNYSMRSRIDPSLAPVPDARCELVFENQRWWLAMGWTDRLMPGERPNFSDADGTIDRTRENIVLPRGWEWVSPSWQVLIDGESDREGWQYGTTRWQEWRNLAAGKHFTRRRRWYRWRAPSSGVPSGTTATTTSAASHEIGD